MAAAIFKLPPLEIKLEPRRRGSSLAAVITLRIITMVVNGGHRHGVWHQFSSVLRAKVIEKGEENEQRRLSDPIKGNAQKIDK